MKKVILAALAAAAITSSANAAVLTFEEIGVINNVFPLYTQQGFVSQGYRFSNNSDVIDIGPGAPWSGTGPGNSGRFAVLNDYGGSVVMTKDGGGTFSLFDFFIKGWFGNQGAQNVTGFLNNVAVGSVAFNLSGNGWTQVVTNFANVDSVSFNTAQNIVLIDDVNLGNLSAVPEPVTWGMMILGFGMAGAAMRRRAKVSVTYA